MVIKYSLATIYNLLLPPLRLFYCKINNYTKERQKDYPTIAAYMQGHLVLFRHCSVHSRVVFLQVVISALFLYFLQPSPQAPPIVAQAGRVPGMRHHTFYVRFNERRWSKPQPAFQIMPPTYKLETSYSVLVWHSRPFPTPNTISYYRRTCSSLATRQSLLFISKYDMTLQTNRFIAIATDERILCWRPKRFWRWTRTRFVLVETNSLVLETNTLKTRIRISVTHTASYQRLPNRTYIELTSENVRFHAGEIRKLCRCTTASFKAKFIIQQTTL